MSFAFASTLHGRKLIQYVRIHRPAVASQLSECFGAGTGCGWCRPYLQQIFERERMSANEDDPTSNDDSLQVRSNTPRRANSIGKQSDRVRKTEM